MCSRRVSGREFSSSKHGGAGLTSTNLQLVSDHPLPEISEFLVDGVVQAFPTRPATGQATDGKHEKWRKRRGEEGEGEELGWVGSGQRKAGCA